MAPRKKEEPKEKKRRTRLNAIEWSMIKYLWESGQYTFKALSEQFKVSINTIKHRSSREKWTMNGLRDEIDKAIKKSTEEMLVDLGLPKKKWLSMMVDGAIKTEMLYNVKKLLKTEDGRIYKVNGKPVTIDVTETTIDNGNTLKYRQEIGKIVGWYEAPKQAIPFTEEHDNVENPYDKLPLEAVEKIEKIISTYVTN